MKKAPSVVARLMGVDYPENDLQTEQAGPSRTGDYMDACAVPMCRVEKNQGPPREPVGGHVHALSNFVDDYNVKGEVHEKEPKLGHVRHQTSIGRDSAEIMDDRRLQFVQQQLMAAKRVPSDETGLQYSKEFQEALGVLISNKDMFLEVLGQPNPVFSEDLGTAPQMKRITVLQPIKSRGIAAEPRSLEHSASHSHQSWSDETSSSKSGSNGHSTRIVLLKPTPGKPDRRSAKLIQMPTVPDRIDYRSLEPKDAFSTSRGAPKAGRDLFLKGTFQVQNGLQTRVDESMPSPVHSDGYGGDESSLSTSDVDSIDDGRANFSDLEAPSTFTQYMENDIKTYGGNFSGSSLRASSYSSESSSVIREATKRIAERWTTVMHNKLNHEIPMPKSSTTLGEMLASSDANIDEDTFKFACHRSSNAAKEFWRGTPFLPAVATNGRPICSRTSPAVLSAHGNNEIQIFTNKIQSSNADKNENINNENRGRSILKGMPGLFFSKSSRIRHEIVGHRAPHDTSIQNSAAQDLCLFGKNPDCTDLGCISSSMGISLKTTTLQGNYLEKLGSQCSRNSVASKNPGPSPTSVLRSQFDDLSVSESSSSDSLLTGRMSARPLSWTVIHNAGLPFGHIELSSASPTTVGEEIERYDFVQKLISSSGMNKGNLSILFHGWFSPDSPLNPAVLDSFLLSKEEGSYFTARRSYLKLLFDCVNMAVIALSETTLTRACSCHMPQPQEWAGILPDALVAVWFTVNDLFMRERRFNCCDFGNAGLAAECAAKMDVEGQGWMRSMQLEAEDTIKEISLAVLEKMLRETIAEFVTLQF